MKIYHSAFTLKEENVQVLGGKKLRILRSFFGNKNTEKPSYCKGILLDSGAFSAFNSRAVISLPEYMKFLQGSKDFYDLYANLDVIGDPVATLKNQQRMERAGLNPLPTYHYGEPIEFLKRYANHYDYIGLGGMVGIDKQKLRAWLDYCWMVLKKEHRTHGWGMTDLILSRMYPFYSIDSTTASRAGRTGVLVTPWGQLRVSSGIKTKTNASVCSPNSIKAVMEWVGKFMPGLIAKWEDLSSPNIRSSQLRIIINALYIESIVSSGTLSVERNVGFKL